MRRSTFLLALLALSGAAAAQKSPSPTPQPSIGSATMTKDGTIILLLRAEDGQGSMGEGRFEYKPTDKDYQDVLKHVGGLKPGQTKPCPPWP